MADPYERGAPTERIDTHARTLRREQRRAQIRRRRLRATAALAFAAALAAAAAIVLSAGGTTTRPRPIAAHTRANGSSAREGGAAAASSTAARAPTGKPGEAAAPILMYHVIAPPPAGAPFPGLYVPPAEFAEQMHALARAGWHAVTLDQLAANWRDGASLGAGKPIVVSFDNGYQSQYTQALPVLRSLGWVGDENVQLTGLPPSQGGLGDEEIRGLVRAGWELDTQGISHADLIALDAAELRHQVLDARRILQRRFGVPVHWFCYPSGHYDASVIATVAAAGFEGSTTVVPGWAHAHDDRYRLHRLRVLGGTSGAALLEQIAATRAAGPAPSAYSG